MRQLSANVNYTSFSKRSWVLYGKGEGVVEFRDKLVSLWDAVLDSWAVLAISELQVGLAYLVYKSGMGEVHPIFYLLMILCIVLGFLGPFLVVLRWWTPSFVRITGGTMSILQPHRRKTALREFKVTDITSVQTSVDSSTFHSLFSMGVWLRDGTQISFLRCRDTPEAKWVLKLMKEAIQNEIERGATASPMVKSAPQQVI